MSSLECSTFSSQWTLVGDAEEGVPTTLESLALGWSGGGCTGGSTTRLPPRIVSSADDGDMTPLVSVERGDEAEEVIPLRPLPVRARFVIRRSSWESWLQAKHRLMTGFSRPLSHETPSIPGIVFVGDGEF